VAINAAAALVVAGIAEDFRAGTILAERAITTGQAAEKLKALHEFAPG
jgi:Anthranilate phosphoribosyltransferase